MTNQELANELTKANATIELLSNTVDEQERIIQTLKQRIKNSLKADFQYILDNIDSIF